jgi:hypothetical protein
MQQLSVILQGEPQKSKTTIKSKSRGKSGQNDAGNGKTGLNSEETSTNDEFDQADNGGYMAGLRLRLDAGEMVHVPRKRTLADLYGDLWLEVLKLNNVIDRVRVTMSGEDIDELASAILGRDEDLDAFGFEKDEESEDDDDEIEYGVDAGRDMEFDLDGFDDDDDDDGEDEDDGS